MLALITTTINIPKLLDKYLESFKEEKNHGNFDDEILLIVIGDKKSPPSARDYCERLAKKHKINLCYQDVERQEEYLKKFPDFNRYLPYNSIQRRNIAFIKAYEEGADKLITIDDDNFLLGQNFFTDHSIIGSQRKMPVYSSSSGWYNVCECIEEESGAPFFHRGFPLKERNKEKGAFKSKTLKTVKVAVNAGLWFDDPDIDAITRMQYPIRATSIKAGFPEIFSLSKDTWSPFNSQNTALLGSSLPGYFLSPSIGRYDDIWASYIYRAIAGHLGFSIAYGLPHVRQERNDHNLIRDLKDEIYGMEKSDEFCSFLRSLTLKGNDFKSCFSEITEALEENRQILVSKETNLNPENFLTGLKIWSNLKCW